MLCYGAEYLTLDSFGGPQTKHGRLRGARWLEFVRPAMTIVSQDQRAFSHSFPGGFAKTTQLDPAFLVVGLFSLLGLTLSVLALVSGATADLETIAPFLG